MLRLGSLDDASIHHQCSANAANTCSTWKHLNAVNSVVSARMVLTLVWVLLAATIIAWLYTRYKNSTRSCQELEEKLFIAEQAREAEHRAVQEIQSKLLLKEGENAEQAKKIKDFETMAQASDRRISTLQLQLQQKEVARAQLQQQLDRARLAEHSNSRRTPTLLAKSREGTPIQTSSILLGLDPDLINTPVAELFATPFSTGHTAAPRTRAADLHQQLEAVNASLKAAEQDRDEAQSTINRLQQENASLEQQVEQARAESQEQLSDLAASLQDVQSALEFSNQERDALAKELKEQRQSASQQSAAAALALASAEQQLMQAEASAKQYEAQLSEAISRLGLLETQLHELHQEKQKSSAFARQLSDMEEEVRSAKSSAEELRSTMQAAEMQAQVEVERLQAEWTSAMAALKEQLAAQVAEVEKVSSDRDQLVESLEDQQRLVSTLRKEKEALARDGKESRDSANLLKMELEHQNQEAVNLAETIAHYQDAVSSMTQDVCCHNAHLMDLQHQDLGALATASTQLEKYADQLSSAVSDMVSNKSGTAGQLQALAHRCEELAAERKGLHVVRDCLKESKAQLEEQLEAIKSDLSSKCQLLDEVQSQLLAAQAESGRQAQELKDTRANFEKQLEATNVELQSKSGLLDQLQSQLLAAQAESARQAEELKETQAKFETASNELLAYAASNSELQEQFDKAQEEFMRVINSITDSQSRFETVQQQCEMTVMQNKDLQKTVEELGPHVKNLLQRIKTASNSNKELIDKLESLKAEKDTQVHALETQLTVARETSEAATSQVVSLQEQLQLMTQSMSDEHATHAEVVKDWEAKYNKLSSTVEALKSELTSAQQATKTAQTQAAADVEKARIAEQAAHAAISAMEVQCSKREAELLQHVVEQAREQAQAMSEQSVLAQQLHEATSAQRQEAESAQKQSQDRIKELEGSLSSAHDKAKADAADYENQISQLEIERDDLVQKCATYLAERNSLAADHSTETSRLSAELTTAQRALQQANSKVAQLTSQVQQLQKDVDRLSENLHTTKLAKEKAVTDRDMAQMEASQLREEKAQLEAVCAEAMGLQEDDQQLLDANRELTCNSRKLLLKYQALQQQVAELSAAASKALQETHDKPMQGQPTSMQASLNVTARNGVSLPSNGSLATAASSEYDKPARSDHSTGNGNASQLQLQVLPSDSVSLPVPPLALSPTGVKQTGSSSVNASPRAFKRLFSSEGGLSPRALPPARNNNGVTEVTAAEVQALRTSHDRVTMDLANSRALLAEQQTELNKLKEALIRKEKELVASSQRSDTDNDTFMSDVGRAGTPKATTPTASKKGTTPKLIMSNNNQEAPLAHLVGELRHVTDRHQQFLRAAASPRCSTSPRGSFSPISAGASPNPRSPGAASPAASPTGSDDAIMSTLKIKTNAVGRSSAGTAGHQPIDQLSRLQANYSELLDYLTTVQSKLRHYAVNEQSSPASRQPRTPAPPIQSSYPGAL